jgi:hypothetical protein
MCRRAPRRADPDFTRTRFLARNRGRASARIVDTPFRRTPSAAVSIMPNPGRFPMSMFRTEMLWLHPPRHPPRSPRGHRAFGARPPRYGHARRCDAAYAAQTVAAAHDAVETRLAECRIDASPGAPLDRAA